MFMKMKPHLQCLPGRKENWLNPLVVNLIVAKTTIYFFYHLDRSSPKTFPVDDSISKYVSSCFYTYLKDDDFNKVKESDQQRGKTSDWSIFARKPLMSNQ